jgi:hypothetical protein
MKTAEELTQGIIDNMKKAQEFRIIRPLPDDFEFFGGPVPFDIRIKKEMMTFTVYATSLQEANSQVDEYLRKACDPDSYLG